MSHPFLKKEHILWSYASSSWFGEEARAIVTDFSPSMLLLLKSIFEDRACCWWNKDDEFKIHFNTFWIKKNILIRLFIYVTQNSMTGYSLSSTQVHMGMYILQQGWSSTITGMIFPTLGSRFVGWPDSKPVLGTLYLHLLVKKKQFVWQLQEFALNCSLKLQMPRSVNGGTKGTTMTPSCVSMERSRTRCIIVW